MNLHSLYNDASGLRHAPLLLTMIGTLAGALAVHNSTSGRSIAVPMPTTLPGPAAAPPPGPPAAANDSYTTDEDQLLPVAAPAVLANDTAIGGHSLQAVLVGGPSHGALALNPDGSFSYTPSITTSTARGPPMRRCPTARG